MGVVVISGVAVGSPTTLTVRDGADGALVISVIRAFSSSPSAMSAGSAVTFTVASFPGFMVVDDIVAVTALSGVWRRRTISGLCPVVGDGKCHVERFGCASEPAEVERGAAQGGLRRFVPIL